MLNILKKLFGDKSAKDLKEIQPIVDSILAAEPAIQALSTNELRAKTLEFKQKIHDNVAEEQNKIVALKAQIEEEEDFLKKESLYEEIDALDKTSKEKTDVILNEILPEAFSLIRETASTFSENGS